MAFLFKSPLFRRQFFALVALVALLLGALAGAMLVRTRSAIMERDAFIAASYRDAVADSLNHWLDDRIADVRRTGDEIELVSSKGGSLTDLWRRFRTLSEPGEPFIDFLLADEKGDIVSGRAETITRVVNVADRDYVRAALDGRPFVSPLFQGRLTGSFIFAVSRPVEVGGRRWALAGIVSLEQLAAIVESLNLQGLGSAYLINAEYELVAAPGFSRAAPGGESPAPNPASDLAGALGSAERGVGSYRNLDGDLVTGAWARIERLGLWLVIEFDRELALRPVADLLAFLRWVAVIAFVALFFLAYVLAARLIEPIERLLAAVKQVRDAQYQGSIAIKTGTELDELVHSINDMARAVRDREERLRESAATDSLTGLYNHGKIVEYLELELKRARRDGLPVCFVMADIDHFKSVNDRYGHQAGDDALRGVAELMRSLVRDADLLGRYGGEEFAVILGARDREEAAGFCERVRSAVEGKEFLCAGTTLRLTISLGYALAEPGERGGLELVARADRALYAAKAAGRNAVRGSDE